MGKKPRIQRGAGETTREEGVCVAFGEAQKANLGIVGSREAGAREFWPKYRVDLEGEGVGTHQRSKEKKT